MDQVYQGGQYTGRVVYRLSSDALTDPVTPVASAFNPSGDALFTEQPLVRDDLGMYHISFVIPADAEIGDWQMQYFGTINGDLVETIDTFEVLNSGIITALESMITRIRLLVGEKIPLGGDENSTRFTDSEIVNAYTFNMADFNKTMAELWLAKAGRWAEVTDANESGTNRSLSQMNKAALAQAKVYLDLVQKYDAVWVSTYRVPGKGFAPYREDTCPRWLWEPVTVRA
jgi:hypothetical protein